MAQRLARLPRDVLACWSDSWEMRAARAREQHQSNVRAHHNPLVRCRWIIVHTAVCVDCCDWRHKT
eukprot:4743694-Prymnesium_polylepis.1